jgi:uncharacterized membrane protein YfhO
VSYFFAIAGGYYLTYLLRTNRRLPAGAIIVILGTVFILSSSGKDYQFENSERDMYEIATRETNNYHLSGMEYIPSKVPSIDYIAERGNRIDTKYGETTVSGFNRQNGTTSFDILPAKNDEIAELPLYYYKGYAAGLNGKDVQVRESQHGLVEIPVREQGHVEVYYGGTTVQKISPFISILGVLLLGGYIAVYKRKKHA